MSQPNFFVIDVEFGVHEGDGSHFFDIIFTSFFENLNIRNSLPTGEKPYWYGRDRIMESNSAISESYVPAM